jgi:uncharacterized protein with FMN-binding domain
VRKITLWLFSTVAALVLLFSYRTSTMGGSPSPAVAGQVGGTGGVDRGSSGSGPGSSGSGTSGSTYQGSVAYTRWGPVQVTITVANGKIVDVRIPVYPNGNGRDEEINSYALPILKQETIDAQSADIDTVSGATITSEGYKESLQAALDAAHLR